MGSKHHVNITGGPLVYKYRFEELYIHFGASNVTGSEHQIDGAKFPAEVREVNVFREVFVCVFVCVFRFDCVVLCVGAVE